MKSTFKILCLSSILLQFSCEKFTNIDPPVNQLLTGNVFKDAASAEATVIGLYSKYMYSNNGARPLNGSFTLMSGLSADELEETTSGLIYGDFETNSLLPINNENYAQWLYSYSDIYHANAILDNLKNAPVIPEATKKTLAAETKFLRALTYFYLVNLYGPVPLALTSDYTVNGSLRRADTTTIYNQLIEDLTTAQSDLPLSGRYLKNTYASSNAATALLARVYLYRKDWDNAIKAATKIIDDNKYVLSGLANTFKPLSSETIFQFIPANTIGGYTQEGYWFIPAKSDQIPKYALSDALLDAFEPGDQRFVHWTKMADIGGNKYYYPYKYKLETNSYSTTNYEYLTMLRASEQYLIRAEAYAQKNQLQAAIKDLDSIRNKAQLPMLATTNPTISQSDLIEAIYKERQIEFFAESSHRWFDLKRTNRADAVLAPLKPTWKSTAVLFPIPQSDRLLHPLLSQNLGYD